MPNPSLAVSPWWPFALDSTLREEFDPTQDAMILLAPQSLWPVTIVRQIDCQPEPLAACCRAFWQHCATAASKAGKGWQKKCGSFWPIYAPRSPPCMPMPV